MQNCLAILQSLKKATEGFFQGKSYAAMEGPAARLVAKAMEGEMPGTPERR